MPKLDTTLAAMQEVDIDTSAFTGTGTYAASDDDNIDLATADRGNSLEAVAAEPPADNPADEPKTTETAETSETLPTETETTKNAEPSEEKSEEKVEKEPETPAEVEKPTENKQIPYARFKKELERRKALEVELQKAREEIQAPQMSDVDVNVEVSIDADKFKKMSSAMMEGDGETAQRLFAEMLSANVNNAARAAAKAATERAYENARNEAEASIQSRSIIQEAQDAADIVMSEYDVFNDKTDKFNEAIFKEALRIRDGLISMGSSVGEAILEAAELVTARHGIEANSVVAERAKAKTAAPATKAPNVQVKLEQAAKVPPKVGGEPHETKSEIDIMNMSIEEFEKLDAKEIARLRGDFA